MQPGEFVIADRIINLQMRAPLVIASALPVGRAHPQSSSIIGAGGGSELSLDRYLMVRIEAAARRAACSSRRASVACMPGPAYETPAEVGFLQSIGADAAMMSAMVEVVAANRLGMSAAVICLVTNYATGITQEILRHTDVLTMGRQASATLGRLLTALIGGERPPTGVK
jgi:purine-nucleoside phosphorylase